VKIKVPTKLFYQWQKKGEKLAQKDLADQLALGVLKLDDLDKFGLEHLLTKECQSAIFSPLEGFYAGTGAAGPLMQKAKAKLSKMRKKVEPRLSLENVALAALSRHARRRGPTDNTAYDLQQRKKADAEHARQEEIEKKALALPQEKKDKIKAAFVVNKFRNPLPHNKPKR
jgi:hypothetical protein